jgi:hypothetical protein
MTVRIELGPVEARLLDRILAEVQDLGERFREKPMTWLYSRAELDQVDEDRLIASYVRGQIGEQLPAEVDRVDCTPRAHVVGPAAARSRCG